ncbi:sensor histidine kinase [Nocardia sp. XZ_19_369]|uniref:sensor histidine kinase n=1 Tax=Nocardia sp. XZ_19_369 TaxID=2769487 RepID=UPI001E461ADE|nr:histidine kinase [Nocardia sp. XZ_19_369]
MMSRSSLGWDWGVALVVAALQIVGGTFANMRMGENSLDFVGYLLLLAGPVALIWRRARPLPVLLVAFGACLIYSTLGYGYGPIFLSLIIAFLTAASTGSRWWTYPLVPVGYFVLIWPLPALLGRGANLWQIFALMAWLVVLLCVVEGIRQRKTVLIARRQRAEAARRDEEAQRERRASEERLAIARELHDVLAHSLSLINVQSSVALELFDKKPEQAASALDAIKTASRDALTEVHTLLHSIRTGGTVADETADAEDEFAEVEPDAPNRRRPRGWTGRNAAGAERVSAADEQSSRAGGESTEPEPRPAAPRAPAPSIAELDTLLQRARAAGLTVGTKIIGEPQQLPSVIDVAAARIIQESLTNVVRHAPGAEATVTVRYAAQSVDLTVDNSRPTAPAVRSGTSGGNGIIGMRERTHALGGALTAGPRPSGGFRVAARLPLRPMAPSAHRPLPSRADNAAPPSRPDDVARPDNVRPIRPDDKAQQHSAPGPAL